MTDTLLQTIAVLPVEGTQCLKMIWQHEVNPVDVPTAFRSLVSLLNSASQPLHIIVDIREDPNFPLQSTIFEALNGPFKHPKMGQWLVLGKTKKAKLIANVLSRVSNRSEILWFEDEPALLHYISELRLA